MDSKTTNLYEALMEFFKNRQLTKDRRSIKNKMHVKPGGGANIQIADLFRSEEMIASFKLDNAPK